MAGKVNRDLFYKLASDLEEERLQSAVSLIKELSQLNVPDDIEEWTYVLNRLIKGLASDRNSARLGFSLCLTEAINLALGMGDNAPQGVQSINEFLDLLSKTLPIDSNTVATENKTALKKKKGRDERGILFGKLFALQALLNEPLFSTIFLSEDKKKIDSSLFIRYVDELFTLGSKKNWIRESCFFTLYQTIEKLLPYADIEFYQLVLTLLDKYELTLSKEGLAIYLLIIYRSANKKQLEKTLSDIQLSNSHWKSNNPLARGNLPALTNILRDSNVTEFQDHEKPPTKNNKQPPANWAPRLHFVWDILLPILTTTTTEEDTNSDDKHISKKRKKIKKNQDSNEFIRFPEFWQMAIDESFFNEKASSERKYLGFLIFQKTIQSIGKNNAKLISTCFTRNFMRSLINQSSDNKRLLHKMSQIAIDTIVKVCEDDPSNKLIPCLDALLFNTNVGGSINFDKLTKSKTVSKLISIKHLSSSTLRQLIKLFISQINAMSTEKEITIVNQFALDTILHVVRSHKSEFDYDSVVEPLLNPLVKLAFFSKDNEALNELAKERLYSILSELTGATSSPKSSNAAHSWHYYTLQLILELEKSGNQELVNKLDADLETIKNNGLKVLNEISMTNTDEMTQQSKGLELLLSMCILQLFSGDTESLSTIEELVEFYSNSKQEESTSLVGITEILLSLLAQKKAILRKLSLSVWEHFISDIGKNELNVLLAVLPVRENKQGFAHLFEGADEYEEDDDQEEGEGNEDEEENDDINSSNSESDSGSSSDSDSDDNDNVIENGDIANIDKEATSALAKALNLPENIVNEKGEVDLAKLENMSDNDLDNSINDDDDDESDEESMDDEKMMELDDQLSEIFKRRKEALSNISTGNQRKIEVKESRENVIAFKHRVIDMLMIYMKYVEGLTLTTENGEKFGNLLLFIEPMIKCVKQTLDKSLADKVVKLVKTKLFKIKSSNFQIESLNADDDRVMELLQRTHESLLTSKAGQFPSLYYSLCSTFSIFLGKILVHVESNDKEIAYGKLIDLYGETTKSWVMSKGKFGINTFTDFYNWLSSQRQIP
ncbi:DNA-directed DNA polymerase NDAI_0K02910 [Naumovozyma dairenensis CBS 421]|uniref:DNA polymerase V n=1 Tax=Naumovozyma dairenensis (strain ATCC 10597 / BCRC 20456 / CBS 421 / NBRC 0211 / NRRL Y-12639) TaxID=1071378 RepID=G0WI71_NAUDC|nr:hypothetical protein NDAI_0K02910 [Naumovozyma dairenensis CBS 421]CCD27482.1 hypothetical protein NDAI_0K02910 [Naumovozyma dairenensis CBS 421]